MNPDGLINPSMGISPSGEFISPKGWKLTNKQSPDRDLWVIPLNKEFQDVGVESQSSQMDDIVAFCILAKNPGTCVNEALQRGQST